MKGLVLNLPLRFPRHSRKSPKSRLDAKGFLRRYGTLSFYTLCFAFGVLLGSVFASVASKGLLEGLDFLFTTNLEARLSQPMHLTFASSFTSNFLFLLVTFLFGLSLWGSLGIFAIPLFKGVGTGLCAGYLFLDYGFRGVGFYLLVMLCGLFLFSFALILQCSEAHSFSVALCRNLLFQDETYLPVKGSLKNYALKSLYMLALSAGASLLDMLLWKAFAKLFF